jgi:FtsH-binding integral membrane protein
VFTGLTAHDAADAQMALAVEGDQADPMSAGRSRFYLNFINLFLFMPRFLGKKN